MDEVKQYDLGEDNEVLHLDSLQDNIDHALSMVKQATRSVHIFTQDFDAPIYNTPSFAEALKDVAIYDSHSYVKIIVKDSRKAILDGHRFIELSRRLSSHIHIRKASREFNEYSAAYLIADETAYMRRTNAARYEGIANYSARDDCRHLINFFNNAWEKAAPDPELRRLHI